VHYEVRGGPTNLNGNHQIDYLTLLVITKKWRTKLIDILLYS
jgi:hypothetical protein